MSFQYKVDFSSLKWTSPIEGVRQKCFEQNNLRFRLVEYSKSMKPHWCEKGHWGYLIEGQMEIQYKETKIVYSQGDGIIIPDGSEYKHRGIVISDKALVFFQENV